jgi:ParB family chromosome partitioning protein
MKIKLSDIKPSPGAVRKTWSEEGLEELAQSIKEHGLIVPIKVRPINGKFELVYGHRRVKALRRAGIEITEAIVEGIDDTKVIIQALIENVQREEMNPIDIAKALFQIQELTGWSQREIVRRGIMGSAPRISHIMALLHESTEIQKLVEKSDNQVISKITEKHVREVRDSGIEKPYRDAVIKKAAKEGLTSGQARRVADAVKISKSEKRKKYLVDTEYSPLIHDAEFHKERTEKYGAHDPLLTRDKPTKGQEWIELPEVRNILATVDIWRESLDEFQKATALGKLAPEAMQFLAHKLKPFATGLNAWIEEMGG